jgi:hypothetical protein
MTLPVGQAGTAPHAALGRTPGQLHCTYIQACSTGGMQQTIGETGAQHTVRGYSAGSEGVRQVSRTPTNACSVHGYMSEPPLLYAGTEFTLWRILLLMHA